MDLITIDGLDEDDFRRSIESMLRHGQADSAAIKLRGLLEPYAGENKILPSRFLTVSSAEVTLAGWDELGQSMSKYDRPNHRISAFSVTVTDPQETKAYPDEAGNLSPCIETHYYSDDAYPFSEAARCDLLEGYSHYGSEWQGNFEEADTALSVEGIDDLYGAIARLEAKLMGSAEPGKQEIRAGSLGACYLAVLIHQAVRDNIRKNGLPRPLCVMAGSIGVYPYFDAPVMSCEECLEAGAINARPDGVSALMETAEPDEGESSERLHEYGSLLSLGTQIRRKQPVLTLDPAEAAMASRHYELGAAHHMTVAGSSARIGVLPDLEAMEPAEEVTAFGAPEETEGPGVFDDFPRFGGPFDPEANDPDDDLPDFASPVFADDASGADLHEDSDDPALPELVADALERRARPDYSELPIAIEESEDLEEASEVVAPAELGAVACEAETAKSIPAPSGHSFRIRAVQPLQPRATLAGRIAAFLHWLHDRMKRS